MSIDRPISEKEWQARYDAESLAKAEEIKADPGRLNAAQTAAVKIAEEKAKELTGINRVAKTVKTRKNNTESTPNGVKAPSGKPKTVKRAKKGGSYNVFQRI
jgi:hypothetical protein